MSAVRPYLPVAFSRFPAFRGRLGQAANWPKSPGCSPDFAVPLRGPMVDVVPVPRLGLDVQKLLMFSGPGCDEFASQIKDWPTLFSMSETQFKELGYKHAQTWNILRTLHRYREGWLPDTPWVMSPKFKRRAVVQARLAELKKKSGGKAK
eukprot:RCo027189